jgi:hypothetical protein
MFFARVRQYEKSCQNNLSNTRITDIETRCFKVDESVNSPFLSFRGGPGGEESVQVWDPSFRGVYGMFLRGHQNHQGKEMGTCTIQISVPGLAAKGRSGLSTP